ncbi:MAG: beta-galactosidase trimerization domain-containing protein [Bacillota bacterium]
MARMNNDDYQKELYNQLHQSEVQDKFRKIAPMPIGVVFCEWPGMTLEDIREHFRMMKELGFTALKQIMLRPGTSRREVMHAALDEGIIPWWYGEGGWAPITDELLTELGISKDLSLEEIREHEKMQEYQEQVLRDRIDKQTQEGLQVKGKNDGYIHGPALEISPDLKYDFMDWLKDEYKTIDNLNDCWNLTHVDLGEPFSSWQDLEEQIGEEKITAGQPVSRKEYRHIRDILRFKADSRNEGLKSWAEKHKKVFPHEPVRAGGEMGLFLPFSARGTYMEGIAETMTEYGSFYPSIHLAWHFSEVDHEIAKPVYMQASITTDWFKGGWNASWESTGGPQQLSGGKNDGSFTVDDGVMTQLMLSYLAAGYRGFGFWCWSVRTAGWEAGEFALLDRNLRVTDRARKAGKIGKAARKYRDELWEARKEPVVGVFQDWDNEAFWAAIAVSGQDEYKQLPINARVGVSRALINDNIPWEHVTADDLRDGLADRYQVIYLPAVISVNKEIMEILSQYVKQGGRLVVDMPSAWYDEYGRLFNTDKGSTFEKTFGTIINDFQYSANVPYKLNEKELDGFVLDLTPTTSNILAAYDNGDPAITENFYGKGSAVLLGYEASLNCFEPNNDDFERMLLNYTLGDIEAPFSCEDAVVYRQAASEADHYFFINDGPAKTVVLDTGDYSYSHAEDPVTGEKLEPGEPIKLQGYNGRWLRFGK